MRHIRFVVVMSFVFLFAAFAEGQAMRTWVSGVGDDINPCSRTAPCKTFAGAISKTAKNGEINCLDPAGFGAVTITKSWRSPTIPISESALRLEEGSLYPALHRMTQSGWLKAEWGASDNNRRARYYAITDEGRRQLADEEANWAQLTDAVGKVLRFV